METILKTSHFEVFVIHPRASHSGSVDWQARPRGGNLSRVFCPQTIGQRRATNTVFQLGFAKCANYFRCVQWAVVQFKNVNGKRPRNPSLSVFEDRLQSEQGWAAAGSQSNCFDDAKFLFILSIIEIHHQLTFSCDGRPSLWLFTSSAGVVKYITFRQ